MTWFDHLFALVLLVGLPAHAAWHMPRLARRVAADPENARTSDYLWTIALQWGLTLILMGWWLRAGRPFADLGLTLPVGPSRWWTIGMIVVVSVFFAFQAYSVAHSPEAQAKVRAQLQSQSSVRVILPANPREMRVFGMLGVTAGICEEVMYRGYLLYYLRLWLPAGAAIAAAIAVFGLGHAYQGARGVLLTGLAGAAAMGLYLFTGSLIASIVLHVAVDLANGFMGYRALTAHTPPTADRRVSTETAD